MGMDAYLFEVSEEGSERVSFWDLPKGMSIPDRMKEKFIFVDEEFLDLGKICEEHGKTLEDLNSFIPKGDVSILVFRDGSNVRLPDSELDKYSTTERVPYLHVRELDYKRWGYCSESIFAEGKHPFWDEVGFRSFFFSPEEMDEYTEYFQDPSEWLELKKRFEEELKKGKNVFVYVSY